jgi:hypothetical protein
MSDFPIYFACTVLAFMVGCAVGAVDRESIWNQELINRGLAQYCPDDGAFAFKGECSND